MKCGNLALGALHQHRIERGTYPKFVLDADGFPPVDAVAGTLRGSDRRGDLQREPCRATLGAGKPTVQPRSKELVAPEDMEVYGRTIGIIERQCRAALASLDEEGAAQAAHTT